MKTAISKLLFFVVGFVFQGSNQGLFCQMATYPVKEWVTALEEEYIPHENIITVIQDKLFQTDSARALEVLAAMKRYGSASSHYFNGRISYLNAIYRLRRTHYDKRQLDDLFGEALNEAYLTANEQFIADMSWRYGLGMENMQELELAATYLLNAAELDSNLVFQTGVNDQLVAERLSYMGALLFHARLYEQSIYYIRRFINLFSTNPLISARQILSTWNTLGQAYQKMGKLDSAMKCYQISFDLASTKHDTAWRGINAGFKGQIYFLQKQYDKAKPLLQFDYDANKNIDFNIAGYTLHWLGRIDLAKGRLDSALQKLTQSVEILHRPTNFRIQNRQYREAAYYALAEAYRMHGNTDSFQRYFQLYLSVHDSLQQVNVQSSLNLARMRFKNGENYYAVQLLEQKIKTEKLRRDFVIAAVLLLSVIALLALFKQRQKSQYRQQMALQQKAAAEKETAAAKEQLALFTQNILEKAALIEKLQRQVQERENDAVQQQLLEDLSQQTILTEEDWIQFKRMFENVYPGFFIRLKKKTFNITAAEQRMAALTRLHFTNGQIASMLGISPDSVRKSRLRLRHRLGLPADANLGDVFAAI